MRSHISPGYVFAAVLDSVLSLRWLPFCLIGHHKLCEVTEVWGVRRFCLRCGNRLGVGR